MKGFCFSFLKIVLLVVCLSSTLPFLTVCEDAEASEARGKGKAQPGMRGPTEGADPLEARSGNEGLTDNEKVCAEILFNKLQEKMGHKATKLGRDKELTDEEKECAVILFDKLQEKMGHKATKLGRDKELTDKERECAKILFNKSQEKECAEIFFNKNKLQEKVDYKKTKLGGDKGLKDEEKEGGKIPDDESGEEVSSGDEGSKDEEKEGGKIPDDEFGEEVVDGDEGSKDKGKEGPEISLNKEYGEKVDYKGPELSGDEGSKDKGKRGWKIPDDKFGEDVVVGDKGPKDKAKEGGGLIYDEYGEKVGQKEVELGKDGEKKGKGFTYNEYGQKVGQKETKLGGDKGPMDIVKEGGGFIYNEYGEKVGYQETEIGKDEEKKDAGILYNEFGQVVGQKETTISKDKGSKDKEKGDEGVIDAYTYTDAEGNIHEVEELEYDEFGEVVSYEETEVNKDVDKIKVEKGKDGIAKGKPPERGVKPGDSKDLEDVLKGTKKAEKKPKLPSPPKDEADILYDEFGEEIGQKEVEISKDKGSKDIVKEGGGFVYNEYGEKVGYQETEIGKDKGSKNKGKEGVKIPFDNKLQEKVGKGVTPSGGGESTDKAKKGITTLLDGTFDKLNTDVGLDNVSEVDKVDIQIEKQKRIGMEIRRIGGMIGQGKPISEIQKAWETFVKGADAKSIMPAINGVLQEAIQEALRNAQPASATTYDTDFAEAPDIGEWGIKPGEAIKDEDEEHIGDVTKMLYDTADKKAKDNVAKGKPPDKGVKPGDSKDLEDVLKGTKKAEKKLKLPSPPKEKAYKWTMEPSEPQEPSEPSEEYSEPLEPSEPIEVYSEPSEPREVELESQEPYEYEKEEEYDLEKQKRTGMEIKRIGKMIGQGKPISEIQTAWETFVKGADAGAIMPAINGVLQEAIQEAMRNARHSGGKGLVKGSVEKILGKEEEAPKWGMEPGELSEPSEPIELDIEPIEDYPEDSEDYEGAIEIADITKMLYDTVVAIRGKDLPPDWYRVEAETSLELPKITAPSLDIEKQKLPTIKPPKVIKMPKTVERPRPVEMPRPPAVEKPTILKPSGEPGRPGAGGTGRPSGGRR